MHTVYYNNICDSKKLLFWFALQKINYKLKTNVTVFVYDFAIITDVTDVLLAFYFSKTLVFLQFFLVLLTRTKKAKS